MRENAHAMTASPPETPAYEDGGPRVRALNPLALAVFAVALVLGGLLIWLSFAGGAAPDRAIVVPLEAGDGTENAEVLLEGGSEDTAVTDPAAADGAGTAGDTGSAEGSMQRVGSLAPLAPGAPLPEAPLSGLFEQTAEGGILPVIAADGRRAVASYARPFALRTGADGAPLPRVAVIISGLGLNKTFASRTLEQLPADVSLAFTPYTPDLQDLIAAARADGHEVAIELPMEPFDYPDNDPGPYTLLTGLPPEANAKRLDWLLSRGAGYFAAINRQGGRYMADKDAIGATLEALAARGLGFIDTGDGTRSATGAAAPPGYELAIAAQIVDAARSPGQIDRALAALERTARETGMAVGVGTALPITVERVADWAADLDAKGLQLVPVSAAFVRGDS